MAASALEKDYVHRLFAMLKENGQDVFMRISQCASWERSFLEEGVLSKYDQDRDFDADIVIFRLGENVAKDDRPFFKEGAEKFITHICPNGKVIFTTCFWDNPIVDNAIKAIAADRGEPCIDCCFSKDKKNMALGQFEHKGVSLHPSDEGMEEIAKAIFEQLKK
jgi:alpha-galactosidase